MSDKLPPRLTVEEVNEFNPSYDHPLEVKCDTGKFTQELREISIISPVSEKGRVIIILSNQRMTILNAEDLKEYPSQKKPTTKMVQFYQGVAYSDINGLISIGNVLVTKNYRLSNGELLKDSERVLKLIPFCELEMPIDFEE